MKRKVTIIGAGNVGSTIAYTLALDGVANEIVIIDVKKDKAEGEAMDIAQGSPFFPGSYIYAGDYIDAADSDIVIITCGVSRKPGQTRLDLAQTNVGIMRDIAKKITRYAPNAIYLVVSNPVDIMTYVLLKETHLPENHIIGSGTILDTARLRSYLASHFDISQQNVHAYVFGEHGDSSFIPWSQASISCVNVDKFPGAPVDHEAAYQHMRTSGAQIINRKGSTFYAVAVSTVHICKCIFSAIDTALTVSTIHHGEYGLDDICLSTLTLVGQDGIKARVPADLTEEELKKLHHSADCLRTVMNQLEF